MFGLNAFLHNLLPILQIEVLFGGVGGAWDRTYVMLSNNLPHIDPHMDMMLKTGSSRAGNRDRECGGGRGTGWEQAISELVRSGVSVSRLSHREKKISTD